MKSQIFRDKKKLLISSLLVAIVATTVGGGIYLSTKKKTQTQNQAVTSDNQTTEDTTKNIENKESTANNNTSTQTPTTNNSSNQTQQLSTDKLTDVTLQGTLSPDDNSISISLYGGAGTYLVEKMVNNQWITVVNNASYTGAGGLDLGEKIPVSETQRTYRVYRVNGAQKSEAKEIVIDRNLVVSKGGISSFPGAL